MCPALVSSRPRDHRSAAASDAGIAKRVHGFAEQVQARGLAVGVRFGTITARRDPSNRRGLTRDRQREKLEPTLRCGGT